MRFFLGVALAFVALLGSQPCVDAANHGYALGFQGHSIAGFKNGPISFTDPGWEDVDKEFTISFWVNYYETLGYVMQFSGETDTFDILSWFVPLWGEDPGFAFGGQWQVFSNSVDFWSKWNHVAITVSSSGARFYVNGDLLSVIAGDYSLRVPNEDMYFSIGAFRTSTSLAERISIAATNAFQGAIDELALWSRVLNTDEIAQLKDAPMDTSTMNFAGGPVYTDASYGIARNLVIYYDFEVRCTSIPGGVLDGDCTVTGDNLVKNYGVSGTNYDLHVGRMSNVYTYPDEYQLTATGTVTKFDKPLPARSAPSPLTAATIGAASVYYATPGRTIDISVGDFTSFQVKTNPSVGTVQHGGSNIVLNTDVNDSTFQFVAPSAGVFSQPAYFTISVGGNNHQVHIWPHQKPEVRLFTELYDRWTSKEGVITSLTPRSRTVIIAKPPGLLTLDFYSDVPTTGLVGTLTSVNTGVVSAAVDAFWERRTSQSGLFNYYRVLALMGNHGNDLDAFQFSVRPYPVYNETDFLVSNTVTIPIDVPKNKDPPNAGELDSEVGLEEGTKDGFTLRIDASVTLPNKSGGIAISQLPTKGELYAIIDAEGNREKIVEPYQAFDLQNVFDQYAYEVVKLSSFFGTPPDLRYHPIGILGRPNCDSGGECFEDDRFDNLMVDDIIYVDRYYNDASKTKFNVAAKITAVHAQNKFDLVVLPLQKRIGSDQFYTKCYMVGQNFPDDCSETEYANIGAVFQLKDVPLSALSRVRHGVYSPRNSDYRPDETFVGGDYTAAYGDQYYFAEWNQKASYESFGYTEFIELRFKQAVYPVGIQIGSSLGGGAIVNVMVKDPDGKWDSLFSSAAQVTEHGETTAIGIYHLFDPTICRPFYKTDHVRIELDTSAETGIPGFSLLDYVKLSGTVTKQPAALLYPINTVTYIPYEDSAGTDTFRYFATDCGGDRRRNGPEKSTVFNIADLEDKPRGATVPTQENLVVAPLDSIDFRVDAIEVDLGQKAMLKIKYNQDVFATSANRAEDTNAKSGKFELLVNGVPTGPVPSDTVLETQEIEQFKSSVMVRFTAPACSSVTDSVFQFDIIAINPDDGTEGIRKTAVTIDCKSMDVIQQFDYHSDGATVVGITLGSIGILITIFATIFNIYYRNYKIVRVTSPKINLVICAGIGMVYIYLIVSAFNITDIPECQVEDFLGDSLPGTTEYTCPTAIRAINAEGGNSSVSNIASCCSQAVVQSCTVPTLFLALGLLLTYSMLVGKTERIIALMMPKDLRRKVITDTQVFGNGMMIFMPLTVVLMVWYLLDPVHVRFQQLPPIVEYDVQKILLRYDATCNSDHYGALSTILIGYIALVVGYGFFQAWKVRGVYIKQANDSRSIAVSVYNIFVLGSLCLVIQYTVEQGEPKHLITQSVIWLCCTVTLVALFAERAYEVISGQTQLTDERAITEALRVPRVDGSSYVPRSTARLATPSLSLTERAVKAPFNDKSSKNPLRRKIISTHDSKETVDSSV